jgi:hypothetical protein
MGGHAVLSAWSVNFFVGHARPPLLPEGNRRTGLHRGRADKTAGAHGGVSVLRLEVKEWMEPR